jgi:hypothetical protein
VGKILEYLKSIGIELPRGSIKAFKKASRRDWELNEVQKSSPLLSRHILNLRLDLQDLEEGAPYLFIGRLKKSTSPLLEKLLPPKALAWFQDPNSFADMMREELLKGMKSSPIATASHLKDLFASKIGFVRDKLKRVLPASLYAALADSLRKDLDELTGDVLRNTIWEKMTEGNLEKVLSDTFSDVFSDFQNELLKKINDVMDDAKVPLPLKLVFDDMGFSTSGNSEFWIEIRKTGEGLCLVKLHGNDGSEMLAPKTLPIEFRDVPQALLNSRFCESMIRFPLWIENKEDYDFSIKDVYETLVDLLESPGQSSEKLINGISTWKMVESYLGSSQDAALEGHLEREENKDALNLRSIFTDTESTSNKTMILPPLVQDLIAQMGGVNTDGSKLKEVLSIIMGEKMDDSIDLFLSEIPKGLPGLPASIAHGSVPKTWSQILGFSFVDDLKKMRISLLHALRLGSKISVFIATLVSWTVTVDFLTGLLLFYFPGLALVVGVSAKYLAAAFLMYGDKVLVQLVPNRFIHPIQEFFAIYHKVISAIEYKIYLLLLKIGSKYLLSKEYVSDLKTQIEVLKSQLLREGEIDYKLSLSEDRPEKTLKRTFLDRDKLLREGAEPKSGLEFCELIERHEMAFWRYKFQKNQHFARNSLLFSMELIEKYFPDSEEEIAIYGERIFLLLNKFEDYASDYEIDSSLINRMKKRIDIQPKEPEISLITIENVREHLVKWTEEANAISDPLKRNHYLNQRVRNLPIPDSPDGELWSELTNPDQILEDLESLMSSFSYQMGHRTQLIEFVISIYALYAIIDTCAKNKNTTFRLPDSYPRDGSAFLSFFNTPGVRPLRERTRKQMRDLVVFFGGDFDRFYKKKKKGVFLELLDEQIVIHNETQKWGN